MYEITWSNIQIYSLGNIYREKKVQNEAQNQKESWSQSDERDKCKLANISHNIVIYTSKSVVILT